ncbi:MAG: hypothetical protein JRN15_15150 [Nitrososphaerota archaeon]|nr:hypothetical protein [Nitrososphaerota archaeon]
MKQVELPKRKNWYYALGSKLQGRKGLFFLDLDTKNFDLYETKHGIHLIAKLNKPFDYMFDRIRISPKYEEKTGETVNNAPRLIYCKCPKGVHLDKRLQGSLEVYPTWSK